MMFMRTIVALSLAAFAFAVPVGEAAGNQVPTDQPKGLPKALGGLGETLNGLLSGDQVRGNGLAKTLDGLGETLEA
ncbi:hypothetical protein EDB85DRAFT_1951077 [Lactarius pseudohatsudake]|nr:hypothetical protein EDB85DRAFT_1951077 [Lactarius pseudohatsudake]